MSRNRSGNDPLLAAALDYHRRGRGVIPLYSICEGKCTCAEDSCTHPGKHPIESWKQYQSRRPSKAEIRAWWAQHPDANVGIITGSASGCCRSEEHTSELQSPCNLVCRLLLEKKKKKKKKRRNTQKNT